MLEQSPSGDGIESFPRGARAAKIRSSRGAAGFSLIEILISVALVGLVVIALASGLLFLVRTTNSTRELQHLNRALGNLYESAKSLEYQSCLALGVGELPGEPDPSGSTADADAFRSYYLTQMVAPAVPSGDPADLARVLEEAGPDNSGRMRYRPTEDWRPVEGITVDVVAVEFWEKVTPPVATPDPDETRPGDFQPFCPFERTRDGALVLDASGAPIVIDDGSQRLTIVVRLGDTSVRTQLVKADRRPGIEAGP